VYHQYGSRRNRSTIDQIFCIRQILEKKWEYNGTVRQLFIDFKKAYISVKRVLYNILLEFGIVEKLVTLDKMYLHDKFPIQNGLKLGDSLYYFALEYAIS
jgi:hypothetical protein